MSEKKTGGPAFPCTSDVRKEDEGLSIRDYFAGKALVGILSGIKNNQDIRNNYHHAADEAYGYAYAMLSEREK